MIDELISTIDEVVKYGLQQNLPDNNKHILLEKNLVKLYLIQFDIQSESDGKDYPEFDSSLPDLTKNIKSNFPGFDYYKTLLDINDFSVWNDIATGDAIDDLHDIIRELLEVKWRLQNNSLKDGLWFFKFIFRVHIKEHLLDLLKYMNEKEY